MSDVTQNKAADGITTEDAVKSDDFSCYCASYVARSFTGLAQTTKANHWCTFIALDAS